MKLTFSVCAREDWSKAFKFFFSAHSKIIGIILEATFLAFCILSHAATINPEGKICNLASGFSVTKVADKFSGGTYRASFPYTFMNASIFTFYPNLNTTKTLITLYPANSTFNPKFWSFWKES